MPSPRCVIYARFSPRPNAEECDSVERQLDRCRRYAEAHRWAIAAEYADKAESGADRDRPGLADAIRACRRGDVLLIDKFDRLSRDQFFQRIVEQELQRKGCRIHSAAEESCNGDNPEQVFMRNMLALFAEYQRALTSMRTSTAMRRHQAEGRLMSRRPPYGWRQDPRDPKRIIAEFGEQATIVRISTLRRQGRSLLEIKRSLEAEGIKCRGNGWHRSTIASILKRAAQ